MTQLVSAIDSILKDHVDRTADLTAKENWLYSTVKRESGYQVIQVGGGRRVVVPIKTRENAGGGFRADNDTFPDPSQRTLDSVEYYMKYFYQVGSITLPAEAHGRGEGAVENALAEELNSVPVGARNHIARALYGQGPDGVLASIDSGATSATQSVDTVQYIQAGDRVDVINKTTGVVAGSDMNVNSVDYTNKNITLDTSITTTTADGVYITGSKGKEVEGLQSLADDSTTVGGKDPSAAGNEWWKPITIANPAGGSGTIAQESDLEDLSDQLGDAHVFLGTKGIRRRVARTFQSQRNYNDVNATKIRGGFTAIWIDEIPFVVDRFAPKGLVFGYRKEALVFFQLTKPNWVQNAGSRIWLALDRSNRHEFIWAEDFAFGTKLRRKIGVLKNCDDNDPSSAYSEN